MDDPINLVSLVTTEAQQLSPSFSYQMDGDMSLDQNTVNRIVYIYLLASHTLELPPAEPGQWLIVQNATNASDGFTLTIAGTHLWSGTSTVISAHNFGNYRAMDKDGTFLWCDISGAIPS
jgi:hypothetical protein